MPKPAFKQLFALTMWQALLLISFAIVANALDKPKQSAPVNSFPPNSLQLVFTIFQHGHTTPQYSSYFTGNGLLNVTWFPYGPGQLTNDGKESTYKMGLDLKKRYKTFLGDLYFDGLLVARSADSKPAQMALQLVLAAMFPPKSRNIWSTLYPEGRVFQPIPYETKPYYNDTELLGIQCPVRNEIFTTTKDSEDYLNITGNFTNDLMTLQALTNVPELDLEDARKIFQNFESIKAYGYDPKGWMNLTDIRESLEEMTVASYLVDNLTPELKKYTSGFLLNDIFKEAAKKLNGTQPFGRKLYLYSGTDINIASLLNALNVTNPKPHVPYPTSYITIEVYKTLLWYYVKVFYYKGDGTEPQELTIPGCEGVCALETLKELVADILPTDSDVCIAV